MRRASITAVVVLLSATAHASPPSSRVTTIAGPAVRGVRVGGEPKLRFALPNDSIYGMDRPVPATVFIDFWWEYAGDAVLTEFKARVCRQSYKGTIACGPDFVATDLPNETFQSALLSTVGVTAPAATSQWDSYYVEYETLVVTPGGSEVSAVPRILGVAVSQEGDGSTTLAANNTFTQHASSFHFWGDADAYGRLPYRANLPNDQVYGFSTATPPSMYLDFETATDVPYWHWAETSSGPLFEPVDYGKYDIDYDVKACRQSWTGSTAVCGPDSNLHNPEPGETTYLWVSTAAISSPSNSIFDYYFAEVTAGITDDWTSTAALEYDARSLLHDWRYDDDGRIYGLSVRHATTLTDFPASTRRSRYRPEQRGKLFPVLNDSIYGFRAPSTGTIWLEYRVRDIGELSPMPVATDLAVRLCRETWTGSTVVCAPDSTRIHTTFEVDDSLTLSSAGIVSTANSVWDYYYGAWTEEFIRADGSRSNGYAVRPWGINARYDR